MSTQQVVNRETNILTKGERLFSSIPMFPSKYKTVKSDSQRRESVKLVICGDYGIGKKIKPRKHTAF